MLCLFSTHSLANYAFMPFNSNSTGYIWTEYQLLGLELNLPDPCSEMIALGTRYPLIALSEQQINNCEKSLIATHLQPDFQSADAQYKWQNYIQLSWLLTHIAEHDQRNLPAKHEPYTYLNNAIGWANKAMYEAGKLDNINKKKAEQTINSVLFWQNALYHRFNPKTPPLQVDIKQLKAMLPEDIETRLSTFGAEKRQEFNQAVRALELDVWLRLSVSQSQEFNLDYEQTRTKKLKDVEIFRFLSKLATLRGNEEIAKIYQLFAVDLSGNFYAQKEDYLTAIGEWNPAMQPLPIPSDSVSNLNVKLKSMAIQGPFMNQRALNDAIQQLDSLDTMQTPLFLRFSTLHLQATLLEMKGNTRLAGLYLEKAQQQAIRFINDSNNQERPELVFAFSLIMDRAKNLYHLEKIPEVIELLKLFNADLFIEDNLLFSSAVFIAGDQPDYAEKLLSNALVKPHGALYESSYRHNLAIAYFKQKNYRKSLEQLTLLEANATESNSFHLPTYKLSIALLNAVLDQRNQAKEQIIELLDRKNISQPLLLSNLEALFITPASEPLQLNRFYPPLISRIHMVSEGYHQGMIVSSEAVVDIQSAAKLVVYSDSDSGKSGFVHHPQLSIAQENDLAVKSVAGGVVWLFQPSSGRAIRKLRVSNGEVLKLQLSQNGSLLYALVNEQDSYRSFLQLWDLNNDQLVWSVGEEVGEVADFDWSEKQKRLLVLEQVSVNIYDTDNLNKLDTFEHSVEQSGLDVIARPHIARFTNNGKILIGYNKELVSWDLTSGVKKIATLPQNPIQLSLSSKRNSLRVLLDKEAWDKPEITSYFDIDSMSELNANKTQNFDYQSSDDIVNDLYNISKSKSGYTIYRREDNTPISELRARNRQVLQSIVLDDLKQLIIRTPDGIQLWSLETGRQLLTGQHLNQEYDNMMVLDKTHLLLIPSSGDSIAVLNVRTLELNALDLPEQQKPTDLIKGNEKWWLISDNNGIFSSKRFSIAQLTWQGGVLNHSVIAKNLAYRELEPLTHYADGTDLGMYFFAEAENNNTQLLKINTNATDNDIEIIPLKKSSGFGYTSIRYNKLVKSTATRNELSMLTDTGWWRIDLTSGEVQKENESIGSVAAFLQPSYSNEKFRVVRSASRSFIINELENHVPFMVLNESIADMDYSTNGNYLTAITSDQNLLFLDPETFEPIVKLMVMENGGWLVTDQAGRYDSSSPGNIPNASWITPEKPLTPLPLEIFMNQFYEPALLVRALNFEQFTDIKDLRTIDTRQPELALDSIRLNENGTVNISLNVTSGDEGVDSVQLFRNNQLVSRINNIDIQGQQTIAFNHIQLPSSEHIISVNSAIEFSAYAFNRQGIRTPILVIPFQPKITPNRVKRAYVITVGVNQYNNSSWDLTYAANDALEMQRRVATSSLANEGFEVVSIPLISDANNNNATKQVLSRVMQRLAGNEIEIEEVNNWQNIQQATPDDLILFSFSGHGLLNSGEFYFFTSDITAGVTREITPALLQSALSSTEFTSLLESVDAGAMVMIVDACQSAGALDSKGFKPGPMGSRGLGQLAWDKKMFYLSASQAEQFALESDQLNHGYLSYSLAKEGLASGQADHFPQDSAISMREWLGYGVKRVPELVEELRSGAFVSLQDNTRGLGAAPSTNNAKSALSKIQQPVLFDFAGKRDIPLQ